MDFKLIDKETYNVYDWILTNPESTYMLYLKKFKKLNVSKDKIEEIANSMSELDIASKQKVFEIGAYLNEKNVKNLTAETVKLTQKYL